MRLDSLALVAGALIVLCAQIVLAPNIAIFSAMPNFCLAYALVVAITRPANNSTLVLAFLLGLAYDLLGHGPVGITAFLLVLAAFAISRVFTVLDNDSVFMPILILLVATFLIEMLYAVFMVSFGASTDIVDAFVYRALPCTLYDCAAGLLLYPLALKFLSASPRSSGASSLPSSMNVSLTSDKNLGTLGGKKRRH